MTTMHHRIIVIGCALLGCRDQGAAADGNSTGVESTGSATTSIDDGDETPADTTAVATDGGTTGATDGPTFAEDVAPILAAHCWGCHVDGGIAPFDLVDYETAASAGAAIVAATSSRAMPPWPLDASGDCQHFVDERWLSDDELATLAAWQDAGAPSGDLTLAPAPPQAPPGLTDVSATIAIEPYTPEGSAAEPLDDYRCFVIDPPSPTDTVLTAFEVHPGVAAQAHHVVVFSLGTDEAEAQAMAQSGTDGRPGYTCFGGAGVSSAEIVAAWAPGVPVGRYPDGTGARVPGGRRFVLQMHYNLSAGALEDATSIDLAFDDTAIPLRTIIAIDANLAIPPETDAHEETNVEPLSDEPVTLVTAFPHMHQLGRTLRVELADGTCVIDVPRWDFHWQQTYSFADPVVVPGGAQVGLRCTYDSTGVSGVTNFGEGTSDEMCVVQFFALP
jgi:hypothetical protein